MKLEKREISLNEADSLQDAFLTEKSLLFCYLQALERVTSKSTRQTLRALLDETVQDLFFICDLKKSVEEE
jgi:hypothetical protein